MSDNVIQIGDLIIRRRKESLQRYPPDDRCRHTNLTWDDNGQIVTCDDCKKQISPYWALKILSDHYEKSMQSLQQATDQVAADAKAVVHLKAAKRIEQVWKSRTMVPCCPHCDRGILAEDMMRPAQIRREFEIKRRQNGAPSNHPGLTKE